MTLTTAEQPGCSSASDATIDADRTQLRGVIQDLAHRAVGDDDRWSALVEIGVPGLGLPESRGGSGGTFGVLADVFTTLAGRPTRLPLLAQTAAIRALAAAPPSAAPDSMLTAAVAGRTRLGIALTDLTGEPGSLGANPTGDGWRLQGQQGFVLEGAGAEQLLLVADTGGGRDLFAVDVSSAGVEVIPLAPLDTTRPMAAVRLNNAPAVLLATAATWRLPRLLDEIAVLVSADCVGGAERLLTVCVAYAGQRLQFGRPIGSFQAVKHRLADMSAELDQARAAVEHAVAQLDADTAETTDRTLYASVAKATAGSMYLNLAQQAIQTLGGIGFTWEHEAHLHLKRAQSNAHLGASTSDHLAIVADLIGL